MAKAPIMEVRETHDGFAVIVALVDVDPADVSVDVTVHDIVIRADTTELFGSAHFPRPVDPGQARADCRRGVLTINVPTRADAQTTRATIKAA